MFEGAAAVKTEYLMDSVKDVSASNHAGHIIYEGQSSFFIMT
jgi:hypothetical protein